MSVPLPLPADPRASYLAHQAEIDDAIRRVLDRGWYILGEEVTAFEKEFAAYLGVRHVIGVASGTDALHLALRAAGIGTGDKVIVPSLTAVATVAAIELAGAQPVFIDLDPPGLPAGARAVIAVHLYGRPAQLPDTSGLILIEDCAQSHGHHTGNAGLLAAYSFYPTKNLGALGDGGAVATNDDTLAARVRQLRQYGWNAERISEEPGQNSRLDEIQAAILRVKLRHLDAENERRRQIARQYTAGLADCDLELPEDVPGHVYHQYVVRSKQRDALRERLRVGGLATLIHYPVPVHLQPAYRRYATGPLPRTEAACREVLSLPIHPQMTDAQVDQVIALVR